MMSLARRPVHSAHRMPHLTSETPRSRPSPYDPAAITAAIRYYTIALQDLLTEHGVQAI